MLTSNEDSAWDLAQATCLKALEKSDLYQANTQLLSWLFKIAHRRWLNEIRFRSRVEFRELNDSPHFTELIDYNDGEKYTFVREVLDRIYELPDKQRIAVLLVYAEGFTYSEAADILDVPKGTIMSRLSTARASLNASYSDKAAGA